MQSRTSLWPATNRYLVAMPCRPFGGIEDGGLSRLLPGEPSQVPCRRDRLARSRRLGRTAAGHMGDRRNSANGRRVLSG